jgi:hypothetical protein
MRPNRIVVGEVRREEALDLLLALNSGVSRLTTAIDLCDWPQIRTWAAPPPGSLWRL